MLAHLVGQYRRGSELAWRHRLDRHEITLDDGFCRGDEPLGLGQSLTWNRPPWVEPDAPLWFDVLFEDEDLLAVHKPSGLPTLPSGDFVEHTLLGLVRHRAPEAVPMHRLGRGTSGVVLFARTPGARTAVQAAWRAHAVRKTYRALVTGRPALDAFTVRVPIGLVPHPLVGEIFAAKPGGKPATSHVRVLERREKESVVEVVIETGRPHQIRIHLSAAGHPLVGDPLYAPGGQALDGAVPGDPGYLLHAASLQFRHPRTGADTIVCSPVPASLLALDAVRQG